MIIDRIHTWVCTLWLAVVLWSCVVSCVHCVKVTVRLTRSSKRMGGVDGHLEQWVGFAGFLFGDEPSNLVVRLYKEMFIQG